MARYYAKREASILRFDSKQDRDTFIKAHANTKAIPAVEARKVKSAGTYYRHDLMKTRINFAEIVIGRFA